MLQWMGGSRRKVTTSRKSTQKRQKQYFEQRKRQQQQTAGLESYTDGKRTYPSHNENNRSLDILSLANVATVAQEHNTRNLDARDNSNEEDSPLNNQDTCHLSAILTNEGIPGDQSEINEERTSLSSGTDAEYSKSVPVRLTDRIEALVGKGNKLDTFKLSSPHPISFIDLLGDGGANSNVEENPRYTQEAHVAFSVQGLGEVEAKTPVHSPKICRRSFLNCSSPQIKKRHTILSKHLDYDFDDLGSPVVEFSPDKCLIEQSFCSREVMDIFDDPGQKYLNFRKSPPFNWHGNALCGDFMNDEYICNIREMGRNFWNGSNFLDNSMDDLGEGYTSFYENWANQENVGCDKDPREQDIFDGWNVQKKWSSTKTAKNFDMAESPGTNLKHRITEDFPDAIISETRRHSTIGTDKDAKDSISCFLSKDTRESLSRLSEESCTSTTVRGDAAKNHEKQ